MKLAAFGDLHGNIYREFDQKSDLTGSKRLDNIVSTLSFIREYCIEKSISWILFSGDLFHIRGKVDTMVFNAIYDEIELFSEQDIQIVMIAGNHDQCDNSDVPENSLHAFKKLDGVYVFDTVGTQTIYGKIELILAPYSKNAQLVKDYIAGVEKKDIPQILLFHLGIDGGFVGKGNYPMADAFKIEDLRPHLFQYIIGGHFHKRQFLGDYSHAFYCGAPIQHSFSDEGEDKGFYVVDTDKEDHVVFIPIPNPMFITMTAYDVVNEDMQAIADGGHYVRLQVTQSELDAALTYLPPNLQYKVELQREVVDVTRVDVKVGMSPEEVIRKYAEEFNPEALQVGLDILAEVLNGTESK